MRLPRPLIFTGYYLAVLAYILWSYSLTDPNLVLTSFQPYWQAQQWLWQHVWQQPLVLSLSYIVIILLWFASYFGLFAHQSSDAKKHVPSFSWTTVVLVSIGLVFAHNALSHDIFNYIFNAKMVVHYRVDPHVHTALEFPNDLWTRFMHNTHTPAPYGYGWTALSLLPFTISQFSFTLSWLVFKLFNLIALWLLWQSIVALNKRALFVTSSELNRGLLVVFANPLFLIEVLGNGHNDLWMMVPTLTAFMVMLQFQHDKKPWQFMASLLLFIFSLTTKLATLTLAPILLLIACLPLLARILPYVPKKQQLSRYVAWFKNNWPLLASIFLFIPLVTDRSQQFHPWYLIWALVWLPLIRNTGWKKLMIVFSISSMLRYIPWLLAGGYSPQVLLQQKIITWGIPFAWLIMRYIYAKIVRSK